MLQNLLAQRFDLAIRRRTGSFPFTRWFWRSPVAKEFFGAGTARLQKDGDDNTISYACHNTTLAALTQSLPAIAPAYFGIPVVDRTELKSAYDFTLEWVGRGQLVPGPRGLADGRSLFSSLEKQLGVRVEEQTSPEPVLTVMRANRKPAANPAGVAEILGAAPTEFEVADVRPSRPNEAESFNFVNGRIDGKAISLRDLIEFAYDVEDDQLTGGEKWLDSEKFDITAKTAPTASPDTLRVMLQSLLTERFALKFHRSRQPVTVYALTSVKPKLKNADPAERTTCNMSLADGKRAYICQNITMAQFAERLRAASTGYIDHPVVDLTGLEGSYDFTTTWAPRNRALRRANAGRRRRAMSAGLVRHRPPPTPGRTHPVRGGRTAAWPETGGAEASHARDASRHRCFRKHLFRYRQLRLFRNDVQRRDQRQRERGQGFAGSHNHAERFYAVERFVSR